MVKLGRGEERRGEERRREGKGVGHHFFVCVHHGNFFELGY